MSLTVRAADTPCSIGRSPDADVTISHDPRVSRVHMQLDYLAGAWVVVDGGLSANGTYVGSERVAGRKRINPGDMIGIGDTELSVEPWRAPRQKQTTDEERRRLTVHLGDRDRALLSELGRSLLADPAHLAPTDSELGRLLGMSPAAVHTRVQQLVAWLRFESAHPARARHALAAFAARNEGVDPE